MQTVIPAALVHVILTISFTMISFTTISFTLQPESRINGWQEKTKREDEAVCSTISLDLIRIYRGITRSPTSPGLLIYRGLQTLDNMGLFLLGCPNSTLVAFN